MYSIIKSSISLGDKAFEDLNTTLSNNIKIEYNNSEYAKNGYNIPFLYIEKNINKNYDIKDVAININKKVPSISVNNIELFLFHSSGNLISNEELPKIFNSIMAELFFNEKTLKEIKKNI